jgi:hypothetical protein
VTVPRAAARLRTGTTDQRDRKETGSVVHRLGTAMCHRSQNERMQQHRHGQE